MSKMYRSMSSLNSFRACCGEKPRPMALMTSSVFSPVRGSFALLSSMVISPSLESTSILVSDISTPVFFLPVI